MYDLDFDAIRARHAKFVQSHSHAPDFACCSAHASAEDVPALLAAVDRVRAMCAFLADRPSLGADTAADLVLAALENRAPEEARRV